VTRFLGGLREVVIVVTFALLLSILVRVFLVQAFYVPSASMEDTLLPSDRIVASKIGTRTGGVSRGEVVVFKDPGGWLPPPEESDSGLRSAIKNSLTFIGLLPSDSGQDLVKRVIGVGGDRVQCCDEQGRVVVNGVSLDEPYIKGTTDQVDFDVTVPEGNVFVMGDNRGDSRDSRFHLDVRDGGVPLGAVVGRVVLVLWPFDRFATVPVPEQFASIP
jgi:signal peptidase I